MDKDEKRMVRVVALWIMLLAVFIVATTYAALGPSYTYQREVHSHMENAYYANSPELMVDELQAALDGMRGLGLREGMYSGYFYWEQTPDRDMAYQYAHMDSIINRTNAVIVWRDGLYSNMTCTAESLGDVYEEKMDNLRGFIKEDGWSDWIAEDAYLVNYHALLSCFLPIIYLVVLLLLIMYLIYAWILLAY